jgi:hypothetical protein
MLSGAKHLFVEVTDVSLNRGEMLNEEKHDLAARCAR